MVRVAFADLIENIEHARLARAALVPRVKQMHRRLVAEWLLKERPRELGYLALRIDDNDRACIEAAAQEHGRNAGRKLATARASDNELVLIAAVFDRGIVVLVLKPPADHQAFGEFSRRAIANQLRFIKINPFGEPRRPMHRHSGNPTALSRSHPKLSFPSHLAGS